MSCDILIVGQGLAGTLLAWEFERVGIPFKIVDAGHAHGASRVAAGIINPITGQRIVKSWMIDTMLPVARESYTAFEKVLGLSLWREMRVRRLYVNEAERRVLAEKQARGDLGDYARANDGDGFWIEGAARVDVFALLTAARTRWMAAGVMREERVDLAIVRYQHDLVIDCTGDGVGPFSSVPWQFSKGECLTIAIDGLIPDVILNRRHWILPLRPGRAMVGATHSPGCRDIVLTQDARAALEAGLRLVSSDPYAVVDQQAGVRVYVADKRPVVGRHPQDPRLGVINGLGGKGALFAPALARQWVNHLLEGVPFAPEVDVARIWRAQPVEVVLSR